MALNTLLLMLCLIGGLAGAIAGAVRRDLGTAMLGLIVAAISLSGLAS